LEIVDVMDVSATAYDRREKLDGEIRGFEMSLAMAMEVGVL
jgi:hypothetical protein